MNRTIRAIIGAILVLIITFCTISICQTSGKSWKLDVTEQKLYTLSDGTKTILAKLNQPIKVKLYYSKTAALKGSDQIRYFNNYFEFVKTLLEEYATQAKGMIDFQLVDPRPYSDEEADAMRYGLKRFLVTEEESFFFGLVVQTQFGVEKVIPFFSPDRQNFVEYDISYLIDTAITREKRKIGILSSLPVMGDDVSGYMAKLMMMQGQNPRLPWTFVEQLRQQYDVKGIAADTNDINDIDILLVIHPKELPEKTLFAIDQFVLKGGRTIICVDPYCLAERQEQTEMRKGKPSLSSDLNRILRTWGLESPTNTFAGDRSLAIKASISQGQRPEKIIGFLELTPKCFNHDNVITAQLNEVRLLFPGVLKKVDIPEEKTENKIERRPLLMTTNKGNTWTASPFELMMMGPSQLMNKFTDGNEPVVMGYLVMGKFKSSFPNGIDIESGPEDPNNKEKVKKHITGLTEAQGDCVAAVFADVDFISDLVAYEQSFFGEIVVCDNSALMLNTIEDLSGSSELISIRSRGNYKRPFIKVDEIEKQAEAETAEEEAKINAEIVGFQKELNNIMASAKEGQEEVVGSTILQKKKEVELKIHHAQRQLRSVKMKRRERIEHLGNVLRNFNMLTAPAVILIIAVILAIRRSVRKRHYISHASDA